MIRYPACRSVQAVLLLSAFLAGAGPVTVWREAEDIATNWGFSPYRPKAQRENANWYSGRGGAMQREGGTFTWRFRIRDEVDPETLQPLVRTYHVFVRLYGYRQNPPIRLSFDGTQIADFRTRKTEKTDAQGNYIGAGTFYWEPGGEFTAAGGQHHITVELKEGTAWIDAIMVTTDADLRPELLECRDGADATHFIDLRTHEIHTVYRHNGVSPQVICPVVFRPYPLGGKAFFVEPDQQAVLHLLVPAAIRIVGASSHFAGVSWKSSRAHKHLSWRELDSPTLPGEPARHYGIDISYMGLDLLAFMDVDAGAVRTGAVLNGRYWLEFDGEGQEPQGLPLHIVDIPAVTPFETIFIGPAGGNATHYYADYPDIARVMRHSGLNICNPWWLDLRLRNHPDVVAPFLAACRAAGVMIIDEHSPFFGTFGPHPQRESDEFAVTRTGERSTKPSLIVGEALLERNLDRFRTIAGINAHGVIIDDENYNQRGDELDYSERCKTAFRHYLAEHTDLTYEAPEDIVANKADKPELYQAWVDFKCRCVLQRYERYRSVFDEARHAADATPERTFFIAQILRNRTPEESKTNTYWDYRLLADICTHISPMIYTYGGVAHAATVGEVVAMYSDYVGRDVIAPTLLAGHSDFGEVRPRDKRMITYEIIEALINKAPGIFFWNTAGTLNALNLVQISDGIRLTQPYEEIILEGDRYEQIRVSPDGTRVRALKHDSRLLVYLTRYQGAVEPPATVQVLSGRVTRVLDVAAARSLDPEGNGFATDFVADRGKLFLLTLAD